MTKKIFRAMIAVVMLVFLANLFTASSFFYDYFNQSQVSQLRENLSLVAANVDKVGTEYFDHFDSSVFRFTLVSADGAVIARKSQRRLKRAAAAARDTPLRLPREHFMRPRAWKMAMCSAFPLARRRPGR